MDKSIGIKAQLRKTPLIMGFGDNIVLLPFVFIE
jgi:hypothetical protein